MKQITVRDKDNNPYTLTFTAETVKALEAKGFVLDKMPEMPMTMIPLLFEGAFLAKEADKVTSEKALEIYTSQKNKEALLAKLIELYNEVLSAIIDEGNSEWECNF